jgi:integrase
MIAATANESNGKSSQATFLKVGQNLYRNESSETYYGLTKRAGKQFRTALRMADGTPIKDRILAERALRKWLADLENIIPEAVSADEHLVLLKKEEGHVALIAGGLAKRWLDVQRANLKPRCIERYEQHIRGLAPFFKDVPLRKISALQCEDWLINRAIKLAKLTFKHELAVLRSIFRYGVDRGAMAKDPSRGIKGPRGTARKLAVKKIQIPTKEQFTKLIQAIRAGRPSSPPTARGYAAELAEKQRQGKAGADLVEFLAYSGCRLGEATALRWRNVDFNAGVIRIEGKKGESDREGGTKNSLDREVPIMSAARSLLERMRAERNPSDDDFVHPIGTARKCLTTACKRLGIPNFTHHDFRHYFVTTCLEAGVPLPTITDWIGHQDGGALALSTYKHIRKDHSLKMAAMVDFGSTLQSLPVAA